MARSKASEQEAAPQRSARELLSESIQAGIVFDNQAYGGTRTNGTVGAGCDLPYSQSCSHIQ